MSPRASPGTIERRLSAPLDGRDLGVGLLSFGLGVRGRRAQDRYRFPTMRNLSRVPLPGLGPGGESVPVPHHQLTFCRVDSPDPTRSTPSPAIRSTTARTPTSGSSSSTSSSSRGASARTRGTSASARGGTIRRPVRELRCFRRSYLLADSRCLYHPVAHARLLLSAFVAVILAKRAENQRAAGLRF